MTRAGLNVPPGFAVTTDAYVAACGPLTDRLRVLLADAAGDPAGLARTSATMRDLVEGARLPDDLRDAVAGAYADLCRRCGTEDVPVAVRSSAVGEDAPEASFAGEHDTYLWVRGAAEVLAAVRRCWASLFTERAMGYRARLTPAADAGDGTGSAMGVAVQQMVLAEVAGVAFTLNPQNGDRSEIAIDASWGFGEAVVSGEVNPDNYLVDKVLMEITRRVVSDKDVEYRPAASGRGVARVAVPADRRAVPCLSDEQITEVARLAQRAERHYGCPQDVEWAMEADPAGGYRLFLLQSRPETVWSRRPVRPVSADEPSGYASIASTLSAGGHGAGRHGRLPSPFDVATPPGAEGWEELYTYSSLFSEGRREYEERMFWFHDGVHWPTPLPPWDATFFEYAMATLSQYNTRHYLIPAALGIDYRILHGYAYLAPVPLADQAQAQARAAEFLQRAGFYFANWDDLYAKWLAKVRALVGEIAQIRFGPLPEKEDIAVIVEGHGTGSGLALVQNYRRLLDLALKLWMHHFEFLNLGYAAYLDFFGFCKRAFPGIPDQSIARMVAGIEVDVFRPDDELKKLARLAVELGVDGVFADTTHPERVEERLRTTPRGPAVAVRGGTRPPIPGSTSPRAPASTTPTGSGSSTARSRSASSATTRPGCGGGGPRAPAEAAARRARPDHLRVRGPDAHRCRPGRVPREAAPGPGGLPLRGEPQLLRRALGARDDLAQDARARPDAGRRAVPRRRGRRVLPAPQRGHRRPLGPLQLLGRRGALARPDPVARGGPAPQGHPPRSRAAAATARARHTARAGDRAVHHHAVGHHRRQHRAVAVRRRAATSRAC